MMGAVVRGSVEQNQVPVGQTKLSPDLRRLKAIPEEILNEMRGTGECSEAVREAPKHPPKSGISRKQRRFSFSVSPSSERVDGVARRQCLGRKERPASIA